MNAIERWAAVSGFEGYYEVSNLGRVKSCARLLGGARPRRLPERIMSGAISSNGYVVVSLRKPGQAQQKRYVHRLVAAAFVPGSGEEINHLDGDKKHNADANLQWCSHAENMAHAWDNGLTPFARRAA